VHANTVTTICIEKNYLLDTDPPYKYTRSVRKSAYEDVTYLKQVTLDHTHYTMISYMPFIKILVEY
jgi:hypothetical protein